MNVVFLDVDGVLNSDETKEKICGSRGIDSERVQILRKILDFFPAEIVLISSWKDDPDDSPFKSYLHEKLAEEGLCIFASTREERWSMRASGIRDFISEHDVQHFIILDDEFFHGYSDKDIYPYWIRTCDEDPLLGTETTGLSKEHLDAVESLVASFTKPFYDR